MRFFFGLVALLSLCGCSTALSTHQPAHTLQPGQMHLGAAMNVTIPTSRMLDAISTGYDVSRSVTREGRTPNEAEQRQLFEAGAGLALQAPGVQNDFQFRYGLVKNFDAGLRYSGTGLHIDGKYQFMHTASGWDGALSVGLSRQLFSGLVFDLLDAVDVKDFSRTNLEVPLLFGRKFGEVGFFWAGPKYIGSHYSLDAKLQQAGVVNQSSGLFHYVGAVGGISVGYKYVWAYAELTMMQAFAEADILGSSVNIGGFIVAPSAGVMARF